MTQVPVRSRRAIRMQKDKAALHVALSSLDSHPTILQIRLELTRGIQNAFRLGLHFVYDNINNAIHFNDLCFYLSPDHD